MLIQITQLTRRQKHAQSISQLGDRQALITTATKEIIIITKANQRLTHNTEKSCSVGDVFQAKFLQSGTCLPLGQLIRHKIAVKFTATDNVSCHSCIYASTDEADESSHSKLEFGLILSGKSCIGDISVKESVELKCFCSVCGQKLNEFSLSHDDDDALSVPAVTLENITKQLLKLILN